MPIRPIAVTALTVGLAAAACMTEVAGPGPKGPAEIEKTTLEDRSIAKSSTTPCTNTCRWANDGTCDDGGSGASCGVCDLGTDCADCGARTIVGSGAPGCTDTCRFSGDGVCDDGRPGAAYSVCEPGTDCSDCGPWNSGGGSGGSSSLCTDTCRFSGDSVCDDGGPGSNYSICDLGTDCADCGPRVDSGVGSGGTPYVYSAYVQAGDCVGGTGASHSLVVEGSGFEVENEQNNLYFGTRRQIGSSYPQSGWNRLTSNLACATVGGPGTYVGQQLQMISPAGNASSPSTISDRT